MQPKSSQQTRRELVAKEFAKVYKKNNYEKVSTFVWYDGTLKN